MESLKVFISSPGGFDLERSIASKTIAAISQRKQTLVERTLSTVQWPTDIGADKADYLQSAINQQTTHYDILLCIIGTKMGTPTPRATSGTEEEFDRAIEAVWAGRPIRLLLFFSNVSVPPQTIDPHQLMLVRAFKEKVSRLGVLSHTYSSLAEFQELLTVSLNKACEHLDAKDDHSSQVRSGGPTLTTIESHTEFLRDRVFNARMTNPQGVDAYLIPLAAYGKTDLQITGILKCHSAYFRFGFKYFDSRELLFSSGSIQTPGQNVLAHVGRNSNSSCWFITKYRSSYRLGPNQLLPEDAGTDSANFQISISHKGEITFGLSGRDDYRTFLPFDGIATLALLAWGDEHEFECEVSDLKVVIASRFWSGT